MSEGAKDSEVVSANNPVRRITTHSPLRYGGFTIYQAGFRPVSNQVDLSVLRVTSDPGRSLKYLGVAMIGAGILLTVCLLALNRRPKSPVVTPPTAVGDVCRGDAPVPQIGESPTP